MATKPAKPPALTDNEISELLKLIGVADREYIEGYGGDFKAIDRIEKKLRALRAAGA